MCVPTWIYAHDKWMHELCKWLFLSFFNIEISLSNLKPHCMTCGNLDWASQMF